MLDQHIHFSKEVYLVMVRKCHIYYNGNGIHFYLVGIDHFVLAKKEKYSFHRR